MFRPTEVKLRGPADRLRHTDDFQSILWVIRQEYVHCLTALLSPTERPSADYLRGQVSTLHSLLTALYGSADWTGERK
jgi:hypothetical protein